jgi:hypothetical protein
LTDARISSAELTYLLGFGFSLRALMKAAMSASSICYLAGSQAFARLGARKVLSVNALVTLVIASVLLNEPHMILTQQGARKRRDTPSH